MIRKYRAGDENEINLLFTNVFGKKRSLKAWHWKYVDNAMKKTMVTVAEEDGELAGHVALVPTEGKCFETDITLGSRTDTMVSPNHRGKGLYQQLNVEMINQAKQDGVDYLYGCPAPKAKELFVKYTAADEIAYIPRLMKMNKLSELITNRFSFIKPFLFMLKGIDRLTSVKTLPTPEGYKFLKINSAGPEFDVLWEKAKGISPILLKRDRHFIDWRFLNHPEENYDIYGLYQDKSLLGYVITKVETKPYGSGTVRNGFIVDMFAENNEIYWQLLINKGLSNLKDADLIQTWALKHTMFFKQLHEKFGFRHKDSPMPLVGKTINHSIHSLSEAKNIENWYITQADVDSF